MKELSLLHCIDKSESNQLLPNLAVFQRVSTSAVEASIYEPAICLILQGSKVVTTGDHMVSLNPGEALLISNEIPVVSHITKASRSEPYLALVLWLDMRLARSLHEQMLEPMPLDIQPKSLSVAQSDSTWVSPLLKYVEVVNNPLDAKILGPSILREIHYRILLSATGSILRAILAADSHANRISKAIKRLRSEFRSPLKVADLATVASMSASSFHTYFKKITGTSPLQFQKDIRLLEARVLLTQRSSTVSEAAFAVGYESSAHFSRDYSKKFGLAPSADAMLAASKLRNAELHRS